MRNNEIAFVDRRQIIDLVCHLILDDFTIRAFEEAIVIRTCVSRERVDKTDVWSLWRLDRAYTSVVSRVNVAHFEACALAGQTTWTESRNATLVRDLRQWIVLIHKLRKLARTEELFDSRSNGLCVDHILRHETFGVGHAQTLFHSAFYADQTNAELILRHLANGANAAVTQVIDVIYRAETIADTHECLEHVDDIVSIKYRRSFCLLTA